MQAGTAMGEAGEVRWDTILLQRGDVLLTCLSADMRFPICTRKKRDCLSLPSVSLKLMVEAFRNPSSKSIPCEAA